MGAWLGAERNQVLYSPLSESYYFVPLAQRLGGSTTLRVVGKKIDVTSSVLPLVASAVAGHIRELARSSTFDTKGRKRLLAAANEVEKKAGIGASDHEG